MTEQGNPNNNRNAFIVGLVALALVTATAAALYIQTRGQLRDETARATQSAQQAADAADTAAADIAGLQAGGTDIAVAGSEAVGTAEEEGTQLAATSTEVAGQAATDISDLEGSGTEVAAAFTESVGTARAEIGDLEAKATQVGAAATRAAREAATVIDELEASGTEVSVAATRSAATARADIDILTEREADLSLSATEGAATAAFDVAALEARNDDLVATATEVAGVAATNDVAAAAVAGQATTVAARATIDAEIAIVDADAASTRTAGLEAEADNLSLEASDLRATGTVQAEELGLQATQQAVQQAAIEVQGTLIATQAVALSGMAGMEEGTPGDATPPGDPDDQTAKPEGTDPDVPKANEGIAVIEAELAAVNLASDALNLTDTIDGFTFDLSGEDNLIVGESFAGEYTSFVAATTIAWGPGGRDDYCGFSFHRTDRDNYYNAEIDRLGTARFFILEDDEWRSGANATPSALNTAPNATNELVLIVQGSSFQLFINDEEAVTLTDFTHDSGVVSITSGTFESSDEAGCTFTHSQIWQFAG